MARVLPVLSLILVSAIALVGWLSGPALDGRFVPGVWIWDLPLGSMTLDGAAVHLESALPIYQPNIVIVGPEKQRWSLSPADLGIRVDVAATLERAYTPGHLRTGYAAIPDRIKLMLDGWRGGPVLSWDRAQAEARLRQIALELDRPARDAQVVRSGTELKLDAGISGRRMEISPTLESLSPYLFSLSPAEVVPKLTPLLPRISDEQAARALDLATTILAEPLQLLIADPRQGDPGPWFLPSDMLLDMLLVSFDENSVDVKLDEARLAEFLGPIAVALYRDPVNATFGFDAARIELQPITASIQGRELDVAASAMEINRRLLNGEHFASLVLRELPPELPDTLTAAELGITELVAVGESYFTGSSSARDRNIRLGASKFDGVLVAPGQTFSFNAALGEVTAEAGYDESYVIIGDRTVPGVGGGICQVATTAFRAAFFAGYPIVERWAHAYRVGYYELGGYGPGFDATVYSPIVDLRWTNDTPHYLLIKTEVDAGRARLRFLFYSTSLGRTIEQLGPEAGTVQPAGAPIYEYDPALPAGTVVRVDSAHDGLKATLGRIVRDSSGSVLFQDTFVSNFVPWPARYHYGPDFIPPADAQIVTPTP